MSEKVGFYLYPGSKTEFSGVDKKIDAQVQVLNKYVNTFKLVISKEKTNIFTSILWRMPFGSWGAQYGETLDEINDLSSGKEVVFIYIRGRAIDRRYLSFLKRLKDDFSKTKIIFEIPTYPYDYELLQDKEMWPWFFKDIVYRRYLKKYVDRIVTFSEKKEIYGIPTIRIVNGIFVEELDEEKNE